MTVLIDTGSAGNFISSDAAKKLGMRKLPYASSVQVQQPDGSKLPLTRKTLSTLGEVKGLCVRAPQFELQLGDHVEKLHLHGLLLQGHEIILGRPWLREWNPSIDCQKDVISFPERRQQGAAVPTSAPAKVVPGLMRDAS